LRSLKRTEADVSEALRKNISPKVGARALPGCFAYLQVVSDSLPIMPPQVLHFLCFISHAPQWKTLYGLHVVSNTPQKRADFRKDKIYAESSERFFNNEAVAPGDEVQNFLEDAPTHREQSRRVTINSSCKENQLLATQPRQSVGEASTYQLIQIFEFKIYDPLKI